MTPAFAKRAHRLQCNVSIRAAGDAAQAFADTPASAHRFGDVAVGGVGDPHIVERGPLPLRMSIVGRRPASEPPANDAPAEWVGELPFRQIDPALDLVEIRHAGAKRVVVAAKLVDVGAEPNRSATGLEQGLTPLIDQIAALLQFDPVKHVLHLELSGEPTKDQLEGLARLRDYAQRRKRETGIDLEVHVAAPAGQPSLRPPTSS